MQLHEFFRETMQLPRPVSASTHTKRNIFVHPSLVTCSHLFERHDVVKNLLKNPNDGPFKVVHLIEFLHQHT